MHESDTEKLIRLQQTTNQLLGQINNHLSWIFLFVMWIFVIVFGALYKRGFEGWAEIFSFGSWSSSKVSLTTVWEWLYLALIAIGVVALLIWTLFAIARIFSPIPKRKD